ncbi:MAG TPA: hypothetical protein VK659_26735, partial [Asanoa sp.]|nr:hypothetical protein [Asanoa sp.]
MGEPATVGRWVREARIELRGKFGPADVLPRTGAFASHTLGYELRVPGAPARISLFATAPEPAT